MRILRKQHAPRYQRQNGITSYLLASTRTCEAQHLTTSLVEIQPGRHQRIHSHAPEQVYYILEGRGRMKVGNETQEVCQGECIFIPSNTPHGIENHTREVLRYFSAAAPSFDPSELESLWPLGGLEQNP